MSVGKLLNDFYILNSSKEFIWIHIHIHIHTPISTHVIVYVNICVTIVDEVFKIFSFFGIAFTFGYMHFKSFLEDLTCVKKVRHPFHVVL